MSQQGISDADVEKFLRRALPHYLSGKSIEDSMRAVLEDDARLVSAAFDRGSNQYFPTPDERGSAIFSGIRRGDMIAGEIARTVYAALRTQVSA